MGEMKIFKAVVYPIAGMVQFYIAIQYPERAILLVPLGVVLIWLGVLKLRNVTSGGSK